MSQVSSHPRYQITGQIAAGDFATVYHAHDSELRREVAIKQIHQQFLEDPKKLDRYWQEAQLLAKLEHPFIMTIYDIVRERGWLILELMQGSLKQKLAGKPMDLEDLRLTLICTLHALAFLEKNGIVHGDVKPTNLLLDKNSRVKLGDFGIARRLSTEEGSVIKGTTKYMAPEVLSDQFGPPGPHSDLYSLGFSAFELMCGDHFEQLFPGLHMFGRDEQMAWMMWHSAPDRRLPEIKKVLQGVPPKLAFVIEKLIEKNPAKRYKTAQEVLRDLESDGDPSARDIAAEAAEAEAAIKQEKRKKMLIYAALFMSVALSLAMVFIPSGNTKPPAVVEVRPTAGEIAEIDGDRNQIFLSTAEQESVGVPVSTSADTIYLNDRKVQLVDLRRGDDITIRYLSADGQEFKEITASRPIAQHAAGTLESIDADTRQLVVKTTEEKTLSMTAAKNIDLRLNNETKIKGKPIALGDLKVGDRVAVEHVASKEGTQALAIQAARIVSETGFVARIDTTQQILSFQAEREESSPVKQWPLAGDCRITLNGVASLEGRLLTLADLKAGDSISVQHDTHARQIDAFRQLELAGAVQSIDLANKKFGVVPEGEQNPISFTLSAGCEITTKGDSQLVDLRYLRQGDGVTITHENPDLKSPVALEVVVDSQPDPRGWAVVIGQQAYDDARLPSPQHAVADARAVRDALAVFYRVPADQLLFEIDATRLKLEQAIPALLKRVPAGAQLVVYYTGHAFFDPAGKPFLAPKEFDSTRIDTTGISLHWLLDQMQTCPAAQKVLLLDCSASAADAPMEEPSGEELAESLKRSASSAVSTSVTVIASSARGQQSLATDEGHGAFGAAASQAFRGKADTNNDHRVRVDELFTYIQKEMVSASQAAAAPQTPILFLPDATPARLTEEEQEAVLSVLAYLRKGNFGNQLTLDYETNRQQWPELAELKIAYGLVLFKNNKTSQAKKVFEEVRGNPPQNFKPHFMLPVHHALAWQYFLLKQPEQGIEELEQLVAALPKPAEGEPYAGYAAVLLKFAGGMREFALQALDPPSTREDLNALDQAVIARGDSAKMWYGQGVAEIRNKIKELDDRIAANPNEAGLLQTQRRIPTTYLEFDMGAAETYLRTVLKE